MSRLRSTFSPRSILLAGILTSLCVVVAQLPFKVCLILAAIFVPTLFQTAAELDREETAGELVTLSTWLDAFFLSGFRTLGLGLWLILVTLTTQILKGISQDLFAILLIVLVGLTVWLVARLRKRWREHESINGSAGLEWRRLLRVRFTIRTMILAVAAFAIVLWPIHLWKMYPVDMDARNNEFFLADLCLYESQLMAARAKQCRERSAKGTAWESDDDVSQGLKSCPYGGPGHSWDELAELWDRAAERSRQGVERHQAAAGGFAGSERVGVVLHQAKH